MKKLLSLVAVTALTLFATPANSADKIVISSKIDTEGGLLGNILYLTLENAELPVEDRLQLGGTPILRKAIQSGEVDIYPEYTGNAAFFYNKADQDVWKDAAKGYELAKFLDHDAHKIIWLTPAPANNTWAIAVRQELVNAHNLKTMSDFGQYIQKGGQVKLAASAEFVSSPAALPAFQKTYNFTMKDDQLLVLSGGNTTATIKAAADQTDGTNAAMVYGTDGAISAVGLQVLQDDKTVQPVYAPTALIREAVLKKHPQIAELIKPIFEKLDLAVLQGLNARIAIGGENARTVARSFLQQHGFLK